MIGKIKLVISMAIIFCLTLTLLPTSSDAYSRYNSYTYTHWFTKYEATVYRDSSWFRVFHGSPSLSTGFEYKNNTNVVLTQTSSFSVSQQTKNTLSAGVDFSGYGVPVNVGGSIETSSSATWGVSNTTSRTIPASAPKGYYSYNVLLNTYKIKINRKKVSDGSAAGSIEFFAPRSQPYRSIVFNSRNASYSGVSRY
ncbi:MULTISPECIES: hypothetical protein [Bacillus]|uniref:hypothetical protein n=1 Tax=Bacillus TaxID=1386 RepID=UPI000BB7B394|nr:MULTISPECIES: hypothetical protein [Bacillus]